MYCYVKKRTYYVRTVAGFDGRRNGSKSSRNTTRTKHFALVSYQTKALSIYHDVANNISYSISIQIWMYVIMGKSCDSSNFGHIYGKSSMSL